MIPNRNIIPYFAVAIAGAVIGWGGAHFRTQKTLNQPGTAQNESTASAEVKSMPVYSRPLPAEASDPTSPEYFAKIAIWATEASAADIERLWRETSSSSTRNTTAPSITNILLDRWVELDPEGALRVLENDMIGTGPVWTAWAKHNPEKALAAAKTSGRKRSIEWVIKGIAENDAERALELVSKDPSLAPFVIGTITENYAKAGKFRQALDLKFSYGSYSVAPELKRWAKEDPHAAMRWCLDHPYSGRHNRDAVYDAFLAEYPDQANELIAILPDSRTKLEFGEKRLEQLVGKDPKLALAFVKSQQDLETRNSLSITLGNQLAKADWETAAGLYKDFAANGGRMTNGQICIYIDDQNHTSLHAQATSLELLGNLTRQKPKESFDLVESIANNQDRPKLLERVAANWISTDRYGFSEFLAAKPPSDERDVWAEMLSDNLTNHSDPKRNDYPSSMEWALSIRDPRLKEKAVMNTLNEWRENDSSGLDGYLKNSQLPDASRSMIQGLLTPTSSNE